MKHIFFVNPAAGGGQGNGHTALIEHIKTVCSARGVDYRIHLTEGVGDATETARALCLGATAEDPVRLYACGGDGTLSEVLAGMTACPHAALGLIPCGTGNDFARNFTPEELFFDIDAQLDGETVPIDLLYANDRPCINMINIGFDCEVVCKKDEYNKKPHFPHKLAYVVGVAATLFRMPGVRAMCSVDGGEERQVDLQLTTMANGEYCGGGFHSNPRAFLCDGLIDVLQILPVSRLTFLRLVGSYKAGTHLDGNKNDKIIHAFKCRSLRMAFDRVQNVCVDGEVTRIKTLSLSIVPAAIRFLCPRGVRLRRGLPAPAKEPVPV